ncbi:trace amine-associated receptor 9-like [Boleophthalmus pectinirostris]|uniref:trace amine-associated receptor 9-like n=1 Tax=Boleophthalmus pectinirostris TaxID=150288 RepID=UPI00242E1EB8|nr:trace amine-associated receptor 9-like [Boleophthalmus pectinirostris]
MPRLVYGGHQEIYQRRSTLFLCQRMDTDKTELCFPHLHNSSCRKSKIDPTENLITSVLLGFVSILTSVLNLLVIIAIAHFRQLHTSTNLALLSLAVSDFLVGLVIIPVEGIKKKICWTLGDLMCLVYFVLSLTIFVSSIGNIILISVDRYVAICQPLLYQSKMTRKVVTISICVCWLYAFVYSILFLLENFRYPGKYKSCEGECVIYYSKEVDIIMGFVIPFSIIIFLYARVVIVAVSQARAMRSQVTAVTSKTSKRSEIKAVRSLGIVVVVYIACYFPYCFIVYSETYITILGIPLIVITISLVNLNSLMNPLMYTMLFPWFRNAIKLIITFQILKTGSSDLNIF